MQSTNIHTLAQGSFSSDRELLELVMTTSLVDSASILIDYKASKYRVVQCKVMASVLERLGDNREIKCLLILDQKHHDLYYRAHGKWVCNKAKGQLLIRTRM